MCCETRYDKDNNIHTLFYVCNCHNEVLLVEYDHSIKMADVSIFEKSYSFKHKMSLWQRVRYCWRVISNKRPYLDEIMLDNQQLVELRNFLNQIELGDS